MLHLCTIAQASPTGKPADTDSLHHMHTRGSSQVKALPLDPATAQPLDPILEGQPRRVEGENRIAGTIRGILHLTVHHTGTQLAR